MILARVSGTVVATRKDPRLEGKKLLLLKPVSPEGKPEAGYLVAAIRPPTVAPGTSRLRVAISAAHERADVIELRERITELTGVPHG